MQVCNNIRTRSQARTLAKSFNQSLIDNDVNVGKVGAIDCRNHYGNWGLKLSFSKTLTLNK